MTKINPLVAIGLILSPLLVFAYATKKDNEHWHEQAKQSPTSIIHTKCEFCGQVYKYKPYYSEGICPNIKKHNVR